METDIINLLQSYDSSYVEISDETSLSNIHELLINNILFEPVTDIDFLYLGWYHIMITKNYTKSEKCYQIAIDRGYIPAMHCLAAYHYNITKDYVTMKKYYHMAIDKGYVESMNNFGYYHQFITKDYITMEKYYQMAIDKGYVSSMNNFGHYHNNITKDYITMEKYYQMAIDRGNQFAMYNFGYYHQFITEDYITMEKYYLMAIDKKYDLAMNLLVKYYEDNLMHLKSLKLHILHSKNREKIIELFNRISALILNEEDEKQFLDLVSKFEFIPDDKLCVSLKLFLNSKKDQLDIMDLHFTYTVYGEGYDSAKEDFMSKCIKKLII